MQNTNRLINDFKDQSADTIWKFMNAMAVNYTVYSTHLKGLSPFLTDNDVYLYCNDTNVVIVCLDCCGNDDEQVYEESLTLSSMLFDDSQEPRVSMVWKLKEAVRLAKIRLQNTTPNVNVYGVLLTEAAILNKYELYRLWDANNVMVIDDLKRLRYKKIKINDDGELACKAYVSGVIDATLNQDDNDVSMANKSLMKKTDKSVSTKDEGDEFEKLLNDFINSGYEETFDKDPDEEQPETGFDEGEDELNSDSDEEDISFTDDEIFPSGEIEQNNNISVKVEILRPIPNPREELDKLVGCTDIKRRMDELVALTSYNKLMCGLFPDSKQHAVSLHSVFLGRPGTGKTTVCKIFGSLLRQAGALSKGHVVVCDRSSFLGPDD